MQTATTTKTKCILSADFDSPCHLNMSPLQGHLPSYNVLFGPSFRRAEYRDIRIDLQLYP
jgi:hypothetical protein